MDEGMPLGYGVFGQADEIGYKVEEKLWSNSGVAAATREYTGLGTQPPDPNFRNTTFHASRGARLVSCSEEKVVVEIAYKNSEAKPAVILRLPMTWRDNDWHADFSPDDDMAMIQPAENTLGGFSLINYAGPQQ